ncbi:MAG: hypothetical protein LBH59_02360 [Planctomycetaceae bacterium]|nr:hypothetical protein [Planctomycetaceae bacterium]
MKRLFKGEAYRPYRLRYIILNNGYLINFAKSIHNNSEYALNQIIVFSERFLLVLLLRSLGFRWRLL